MNPILLTEPGVILEPSELVLNPDGSVYHLALRPEQLGDLVLVVGDPERVARISAHFDRIEHRAGNREFVAHTGVYRSVRITALATGIGTPATAASSCNAYAPFELMNRAVTAGDFRRYHSIVHCDPAP